MTGCENNFDRPLLSQLVEVSKQICPRDIKECCLDVKHPANKQSPKPDKKFTRTSIYTAYLDKTCCQAPLAQFPFASLCETQVKQAAQREYPCTRSLALLPPIEHASVPATMPDCHNGRIVALEQARAASDPPMTTQHVSKTPFVVCTTYRCHQAHTTNFHNDRRLVVTPIKLPQIVEKVRWI